MHNPTLKAVTIDELAAAAAGTEIGCSSWRTVTQEMVDQFAAATDDHQFIHVDPGRAARETPFGGTIAHGFLLLSLLSTLAYEAVPPLDTAAVGINYGFDEVRFKAPVKTGSRVRGRFVLARANIRTSGFVEVNYDVTLEVEGWVRPALTARWLTLLQLPRRERS